MNGIRYWLESLYFSEPIYFVFSNLIWALIAALVVVLTLKLLYRPRKSKYSIYQLFGKDTAWIAALAICALSIVALAGPRVSKGMALTPGGSIDIGFLVDDSFSTRVNDIDGKVRLDVVKSAITSFVDSKTLKSGDRLTLFVLGTISVWRMPLSEDFDEFKSQLAEINHPQIYWDDSQLKTDLSNVIELVPKSMDRQDGFFKKTTNALNVPWFKNNRIMFLFSDGHDTESADLRLGIEELKKRKIKIYSIGVGTQGSKKITIEAYDPNNPDKTIKETREAAETKLEMRGLNEIAAKTGGESYIIDSDASARGVQSFLKNAVNSNRNFSPRLVASGESRDIWWEILAMPAVILLLVIIKKI